MHHAPQPPACLGAEQPRTSTLPLASAGYHFLAYTPATIAAAAIITAWKFSDEDAVVPQYLDVLAHAVSLEPPQLTSCVNAMVRYYQSCFPGADKGEQNHLFTPIPLSESASSSDLSVSTTPTLLCDDARGLAAASPTPQPSSPGTPSSAVSTQEAQPLQKEQQQQQAQQKRYTPDSVTNLVL